MSILTKNISRILRDTYTYYPIGTLVANNEYDGYSSIKKIISDKIKILSAEGNDGICNGLCEKLSDIFKDENIITVYERQFPNYAIDINVGDDDDTSYKLKIRVSLLTNYFTVFYEEKARINKSNVFENHKNTILSSKCLKLNSSEILFSKTKSIIASYFLNYEFLEHDALLNFKIRFGQPYGSEMVGFEKEYSIYDFLFDNEFGLLNNLTIVS